MISGRSEPLRTSAQGADHPPVFLAILDEPAEVVVEGCVDHRVGLGRAGTNAVQVLKGGMMDGRARLLQGLRAPFGPRHAKHLVPGRQKFRHDMRADEARRTRQKDTHSKVSTVVMRRS